MYICNTHNWIFTTLCVTLCSHVLFCSALNSPQYTTQLQSLMEFIGTWLCNIGIVSAQCHICHIYNSHRCQELQCSSWVPWRPGPGPRTSCMQWGEPDTTPPSLQAPWTQRHWGVVPSGLHQWIFWGTSQKCSRRQNILVSGSIIRCTSEKYS